MSFPNIVYGSYGDQRTAQSTKIGSLPLGTVLELPDGSKFRHAQNGGTTLAVGLLVQTELAEASHDIDLVVSAAATVGATSISATMAGTVCTLNQYADGYILVNDQQGQGYVYRCKGNTAAASVTAARFDLADGDSVQVALLAATSEIGLRVNPYKGVTKWEAGTVEGQVLGLPPVAVTASQYFWCQTRGPAMALADSTLAIGAMVVSSTTVDGGVTIWAGSAAATTYLVRPIGDCLAVAASTDYALIDLKLE